MSRKYQEYKNSAMWRTLNRAFSALAKNGDIEEQTAREYIVGYLSKSLAEEGFQQVAELRKGHKIMHVVEVPDQRVKFAG